MAKNLERKEDRAEGSSNEVLTSFFIMPTEALKILHTEVDKLAGSEITRGLLFRYGYICGETIATKMNFTVKDRKSLAQMLPSIWAEIGLGKLKVKKSSKDKIVVEFLECLESSAIETTKSNSCDFTRGYISGVVTGLTGEKFYSTIKSCKFKGNKNCQHNLENQKMAGEG